MLDFEKASINAFTKFFVDADIKLCRFHWAQAIFRKIAELKLKPVYKDSNSETGSWLKQVFGLPLLPPDEVEDAFTYDLMPTVPNERNVEEFCDYLLETYISSDSRYSPEMWARLPVNQVYPTTTNGAESFHRHFKDCFQSAHPNIFAFSNQLLGLQEETYIKLNSCNVEIGPRSAAKRRLED